jgi:UDP-glucose 4-epimerase
LPHSHGSIDKREGAIEKPFETFVSRRGRGDPEVLAMDSKGKASQPLKWLAKVGEVEIIITLGHATY